MRLRRGTVPLLWKELYKAVTTSEEERIALIERLLPLIDPRHIEALVADREFIGEQFFARLCRRHFRFVTRIRKNARLYSPMIAASKVFPSIEQLRSRATSGVCLPSR